MSYQDEAASEGEPEVTTGVPLQASDVVAGHMADNYRAWIPAFFTYKHNSLNPGKPLLQLRRQRHKTMYLFIS